MSDREFAQLQMQRDAAPRGRQKADLTKRINNELARRQVGSTASSGDRPKTTPAQAKKEIRRALAEQNSYGGDSARKGYVSELDDEKAVIQFPWTLRAAGFYDGVTTGTDMQVDFKTGDDQVTVWFNRRRNDES